MFMRTGKSKHCLCEQGSLNIVYANREVLTLSMRTEKAKRCPFRRTGKAVHCLCEQGRLYIVNANLGGYTLLSEQGRLYFFYANRDGYTLFMRTWEAIHCLCEQGRLYVFASLTVFMRTRKFKAA